MKRFFDSLKTIDSPLTSGSSPMFSVGTKLITDKKEIVERWAENFDDLAEPTVVHKRHSDSTPPPGGCQPRARHFPI